MNLFGTVEEKRRAALVLRRSGVMVLVGVGFGIVVVDEMASLTEERIEAARAKVFFLSRLVKGNRRWRWKMRGVCRRKGIR